MSELEEPNNSDADDTRQGAGRKYLIEAILGLLIGALVLWVLIVSVSDVEFIYQGF